MKQGSISRWRVGIAASSYFFYSIFQLSLFNIAAKHLMMQLNLSNYQFGSIASLYLYVLGFSILPIGILLDRFSTRYVAILATVLALIGTLVLAGGYSTVGLIGYRILSGFSNGCAFLIGLRVVHYWFAKKKALASGILIALGMSGGLFASLPFTYIVTTWGWSNAFWLNSLLGVIVLLLALWGLHNHPAEHPGKSRFCFKHLLHVWRQWQNIAAGIYTGLLNLSVYLLASLWANLYLQQVYGFSLTEASAISGMIFLGIIIGSPLWGYGSDRVKQRRWPMMIGGLLSTFTIAVIIYAPSLSHLALSLLFLALGLTTSSQVISYSVIAESNPPRLSSTATGFAALIINLIGAMSQMIFGHLLTTSSTISHDMSWQSSLSYLFIAFAIATVIAYSIRPRGETALK